MLFRYTFAPWGPDLAPDDKGDVFFNTLDAPLGTTTLVAWVEDINDLPPGVIQAGGAMVSPPGPGGAGIQLWLANLTSGVISGSIFNVTWVIAYYTCPVSPGTFVPQ